ncbi:zona pellucida sperm-binding protein 2-like [Trachinotus anak]|uniref:zona pellucida sperm-binding protein 2-like n=1 Tax=Trachinotus anak TaxID=443729 RepID=UPI0039F1A785
MKLDAMEAGALLLLLSALLGTASALSFYGDSISFMPPKKEADGTFRVTFYHRQNGRSSCEDQSSFTCESGVCTSFNESSVLQTDQDDTDQGRWCQSEGRTTATVSTNKTSFSLRGSGCCWVSNVNGKTNWTTHAELDLGTRSDSHALNSCPVTTTVSSLRVPQNCFSRIRLLAHDPDGDKVRCRFSSGAPVPSNFTLDNTSCTLTSTGQVDTGVQVFEVMLEDFSTTNITLTYADGTSVLREASNTSLPPLCKLKLQFSVEILPPIPSCEAGHVQPMFLSKTPSHGDILHATVGQTFQLFAQAQAHHASIHDFQVSGPQNMSKEFRDKTSGTAEVTVSWTPQQSDLYRFVPVCFTAETNETQSEMRCVVVMVTQASITQGKATVECSPNAMKVALEKASMPDIDENFLKLSDPSCSLTSNNTHIMGSMSFSTCGTKVEDKGDFIVFKNEINSFELPNEVITRRRTVKLGFSCQFPKTISISSYYNLHKSDYIFTESSFGSFGYAFEIFLDGNFTNKVDARAYPVEVKLLQKIYMGIEAQSELPNVKLFVESCKATPDDNPENTLSYDIIKNGCLEDETVKVYPSNRTSFNFEVQAFKFTGNYDQVYITCSVILCEADSPFSRCAQGCLKNPSRRRRRGLSRETVSHYITQGPLQFVQPAAPNKANDDNVESDNWHAVSPPPVSPDTRSNGGGWEIKQILNTNISTMVFASAFLVSVVLMAVIVSYFRKKRREEDRNALIDSDWEN